jgi:hypothetical protein
VTVETGDRGGLGRGDDGAGAGAGLREDGGSCLVLAAAE